MVMWVIYDGVYSVCLSLTAVSCCVPRFRRDEDEEALHLRRYQQVFGATQSGLLTAHVCMRVTLTSQWYLQAVLISLTVGTSISNYGSRVIRLEESLPADPSRVQPAGDLQWISSCLFGHPGVK